MPPVKLSWSSAQVKDSELTLSLEGDIPRGWKKSFETTVKLLGDGEWGDVRLKKGKVQVSDVVPGAEDKLRHHLESIVAQANAAHEAREAERKASAEDHADERDGGEDGGPDAEMTGRFRSFANDAEGAEGFEGSEGSDDA
jgi:hypothetical protein